MTTSDRSHGGRVAGKVALITGGRAEWVRAMGALSARARVVLAGRNDDRGEKTAAALRAEASAWNSSIST
jgi:NAD(P)-dependent dehydrogenase (short-subunit alcohol dehydrogenase family)